MSKDPAVLFYTSDFLTGTITMSNEQIGKYIRLLCIQHQKDILTEKDMLMICERHDIDVYSKFVKCDEGYYNERMRDEKEKRLAYSESRRNNRKKKISKKDMNKISKRHVLHMENENENINIHVVGHDKQVVEHVLSFEQVEIVEPFHPITDFIKKNCPTVSKLKQPMKPEQADQLLAQFSLKEITDVLEQMENWVPLTKKSKSAYLTAKNWLSRKKTENGKQKSSFTQSAADWFNRTSQTGYNGS